MLNNGPLNLRQQAHQLIGDERQNAEHQVRHHLDWASDPDVSTLVVIPQPAVGAFRMRALLVALRFMGREGFFLATARVVVN